MSCTACNRLTQLATSFQVLVLEGDAAEEVVEAEDELEAEEELEADADALPEPAQLPSPIKVVVVALAVTAVDVAVVFVQGC
jgi:hypothetical protein